MRFWRGVLLLLFLGAFAPETLKAQTPDLDKLSAEMALQLEIQTHLFGLAQQTSELGEKAPLMQTHDWEKYLREATEKYLDVVGEKSGAQIPEGHWKKLLDRINWKNLASLVRTTLQKSRKMIRMNGATFLVTDTVGTVAKWTAVVGLTHLNTAGLADVPGPLIFAISQAPTTVVASALSGFLEKQIRRRDKLRLWAGDAGYKAVERARISARRELGLAEVRDILIPLTQDANPDLMARISTLGAWDKLKGKLGFESEKLAYPTLKKALVAQGYRSELMDVLDKKSSFSPAQKALLLLSDVKNSGREDLIEKLVKKFPKHFQVQAQAFETHAPEVSEWIELMRDARVPDDVFRGMQQVPTTLKAQEVLGVWREQLLPLYAEKLDSIDYFSLRDLIANNAHLELAAEKTPGALWDFSWDERFFEYWARGLRIPENPILGGCVELFRKIHL